MANVSAEIIYAGKLFEETVGPFGASAGFDYSMPDLTFRYSNATVPLADEVWSGVLALTGGALVIDLQTSLVRAGRTVLNLLNKRVLAFRIDNLGANQMTFTKTATNGYDLFTLSPGTIVGAGGTIMGVRPAGYGTVGAAAFSITVAGTTTETFRLGLVAGTP